MTRANSTLDEVIVAVIEDSAIGRMVEEVVSGKVELASGAAWISGYVAAEFHDRNGIWPDAHGCMFAVRQLLEGIKQAKNQT